MVTKTGYQQTIFFYVQKESDTALGRHEGEEMMTELPFWGEPSL